MQAGNLTSEWADWSNANLPDLDAIAERQRYEGYVSTLWHEVRGSIVAAIDAINSRVPELQRIECGDSPTRGLALTRWSEYPVAFLDVSVDIEGGTFECIYTCAAREGDAYGELRKVWSLRAADGGLLVTDEEGCPVTSSEDLARVVVEAYLANL